MWGSLGTGLGEVFGGRLRNRYGWGWELVEAPGVSESESSEGEAFWKTCFVMIHCVARANVLGRPKPEQI